MSAPAYLWLDAEFSSLELDEAEVLQVALIATDANLRRLAPPSKDVNLFIKRTDDRGISPWVKENIPHILDECHAEDAVSVSDAEVRLCRYVDEVIGPVQVATDARPLLAGNSVHNDWTLVRKFFPGVLRRAHYRLLDVSTLKTQWMDWAGLEPPRKDDPAFVRRWFPESSGVEEIREHDAYYDIQASIAELAFYREKFLVKPKRQAR